MSKTIPLLKPSSTADRVASILRDRILGLQEGTFMGSEADIAAEIGVSLPTMRQASRMLEYEQLLVVKPGKGGGYFTRRPTIETAINSASQYLSSKELISNSRFMDAAEPVVKRMLVDASQCKDPKLVAQLQAFIKNQYDNAANLPPPEESFKVSAEMMTLLAKMSSNVLIELFVRILWNEVSISRTSVSYSESREIVETNFKTRMKVAEAVLSGDADGALAAWDARTRFLRTWPQRGFHLRPQRHIGQDN